MDNHSYAITGTFNGAIIFASSEGEARRAFHSKYGGESIIHCYRRSRTYFSRILEMQLSYD